MWGWLRGLGKRRGRPFVIPKPNNPPAYASYTTDFDVVVGWDRVLKKADLSYEPTSDSVEVNRYEYQIWYTECAKAIDKMCSDLAKRISAIDCPQVVILVDHSGSLRGGKNVITSAVMRILDRIFLDAGVDFEVIGFTTTTWHGGRSRGLWQRQGAPKLPGRLCDIMHIIYRAHDDKSEAGARYDLVFDERILKENIDGEAIEFAQHRLMRFQKGRGCILHVSDGAPVDDSTIIHNWSNFLTDHIKEVIQDVTEQDSLEIAGIGIGYEVSGYFDVSIDLNDLDEIAAKLEGFLSSLLLQDRGAPTSTP